MDARHLSKIRFHCGVTKPGNCPTSPLSPPQPTVLSFVFWLCREACGILVPWPGSEPKPLALEVWSLNHWTAREDPPPAYGWQSFSLGCSIFQGRISPNSCLGDTKPVFMVLRVEWREGWVWREGPTHTHFPLILAFSRTVTSGEPNALCFSVSSESTFCFQSRCGKGLHLDFLGVFLCSALPEARLSEPTPSWVPTGLDLPLDSLSSLLLVLLSPSVQRFPTSRAVLTSHIWVIHSPVLCPMFMPLKKSWLLS